MELVFDTAYLARSTCGGTKLATFKGIQIRGANVLITLKGWEELMRFAWDCRQVVRNSTGSGMIDPTTKE